MENQTPPADPREVKRVDQLDPGDVVADLEPFSLRSFATVRWAEQLADAPGRYLVLFAGGETADMRGATEVQIATAAEVAAHGAKARDDEKRARMRSGLMKLIDFLDRGLPLPAHFTVTGACMPDADSVRAAATLLGVEPDEYLNGGRPQIKAKTALVERAHDYASPEVGIEMWHLADKAVES